MDRAKKKSKFWIIYTVVVLATIFMITMGAAILISWLDAFEQSQPVHAAQSFYDEYFVAEKWTEILEKANYKMGDLEQKGDAEAALKALKKGKKMSFYALGGDDQYARYNVILVDPADLPKEDPKKEEVKDAIAEMAVQGVPSTKIATITLKKSKTEGKYGFYGYEFSELEIFLDRKASAQICIPSHYTLYAGDRAITSDQIVATQAHFWNEHLPEGVTGVEFATYRFENLLKAPEFTVKDAAGNVIPLVENEESGVLETGIVYATQVDQALSDRLLAGLKAYATYMQDDGSLGAVAKYFDTNSNFYKSTRENPSAFVWDHNGYEFQNERIENFYFFDENTLCCYISFDQILKMTGRENYVDKISMTVFAHKVNGTWRIFNCVNS
ncbi:MAG: hypothetical protein E7580_00840 [Ruminococcaceae bacterium]|nr:hypothetical protein [Oscillospiraceae bacterium]